MFLETAKGEVRALMLESAQSLVPARLEGSKARLPLLSSCSPVLEETLQITSQVRGSVLTRINNPNFNPADGSYFRNFVIQS